MAISVGTIWEVRTTGSQTNGAGFHWYPITNSTLKWTLSGSGSNEYFCELVGGGDPGLTEPSCCCLGNDFILAVNGVVGSLAEGEWDWGDNDSLGYSTVYAKTEGGVDPDTWVSSGYASYIAVGYNGGYDYSQQAAAQLSLTNIASDGAGTTITSATGGFTALMVGNLMYIGGGTGFTAGWYEIVSYISTNSITIDRSAGSSKTGGTGKVGGAFSFGGSLDSTFVGTARYNNSIYIKGGDYTLGVTINSNTASPNDGFVSHIGYNLVRGDNPTGDDRPLINCGASYSYGTHDDDTYHMFQNIRFTGSSENVVKVGGNCVFYNCKSNNTSITDGNAFYVGASVVMVGCEAHADGNTDDAVGILAIGEDNCITDCFVQAYCGLDLAYTTFIKGCIISQCAHGVYLRTTNYSTTLLNTNVYGCTIAGVLDLSYSAVYVNTIFSENLIDISWGTTLYRALGTYVNNCYNGTYSITGGNLITKSVGGIFGDPSLASPATSNFSINPNDANVYEQGIDVGDMTSITT